MRIWLPGKLLGDLRDYGKSTQCIAVIGGGQAEHGDAWTVAWLYQHSPALRLGLEYVQIYTDRLAWMYYPDSEAATCGPGGIEPCDMTEKQLQLTLRWLFSNRPL